LRKAKAKPKFWALTNVAKILEKLVRALPSRVKIAESKSVKSMESSNYEDFGFKDQMQKASVSVMNNIAEPQSAQRRN